MIEFTNVVRDKSALIEILDSLKPLGLRHVVVPKVKIRNRLHRNQQLIKDIFFMARTGQGPYRPMALIGIFDSETGDFHLSHMDITHWNIGGVDYFELGGYTIYYRQFCNPVTQAVILDEPTKARAILTGNLMEGNPSDAYRTPNSVDVDMYATPLSYEDIGGIIKSNAKPIEIITRRRKPIPDKIAERIATVKKNFDNGLVYACCLKLNSSDDLFGTVSYRWVTEADLDDASTLVSEYYPVISSSNFDVDNFEIPKAEMDIAVCGCGSAGSQIVDQISRLNYFSSYLLVDKDYIEAKNLRNQTYMSNHLSNTKIDSLKSLIRMSRADGGQIVNTKFSWVEELPWEVYKFKYLINGFDNIEARLFMLEQVESGRLIADYIIDARYDHLSADLYMVDTSNAGEIKMYKDQLLADKDAFADIKEYVDLNDSEAIIKWLTDQRIFTSRCSAIKRLLGITGSCNCRQCGSHMCKNYWLDKVREAKCRLKIKKDDEGCLEQNIVHIYKYVSSWVTSNIKSIEEEKKKLFTHVMCTVEPLPKAIVVKK